MVFEKLVEVVAVMGWGVGVGVKGGGFSSD